jgi:asparagine synthase (glutamine-hydrolysing)
VCGICGELTFDAGLAVRSETLVAMRDRLVHRGPDDQGSFVSVDRRVGLAFRRLRIIDLSPDANQPMANEDGAIQVVFNGEIYNFRDLRTRLIAGGHRFRSHADTEVLVHLYEDVGVDFVDEIDGMFAAAVWDSRTGRLVLARDRAGKKPLFYYQDAHRVVFGSEIKALFAHPDVPVEVDHSRFPSYFFFGYVPHPATFYHDIRQVEPGTVITLELGGRVSHRRFWRIRFPDAGGAARVTHREARSRVRQLVTDAVSRRLESDVSLGAFLSAGIDSTIVVSLMSRLTGAPVRTFTIGFEGQPAFDETEAAAAVAAGVRAQHTEFRVRPSAVDLLDRLIWHHDGPFGDSSAIPTFLVSELTRPHVTVVLTGDGGDEVFAGYLRFRAALAAERLPQFARPLVRAWLGAIAGGRHERQFLPRLRRFARFVDRPLLDRLAHWNCVFSDDEMGWLEPSTTQAPFDPLENVRDDLVRFARASPLSQMLAANFDSYLPDDLLVKTDRCTMANGIEARAPFLDTALVEYVASLPDELKLKGRTTKWILREAFADLIPPGINRRPKTGFGVPLDAWFRGELRDYVRDLLLAPSAASRRYVTAPGLSRLIDDHQAGRANHGHRLWALVCFERWLTLLPEWTEARRRSTMSAPLS